MRLLWLLLSSFSFNLSASQGVSRVTGLQLQSCWRRAPSRGGGGVVLQVELPISLQGGRSQQHLAAGGEVEGQRLA